MDLNFVLVINRWAVQSRGSKLPQKCFLWVIVCFSAGDVLRTAEDVGLINSLCSLGGDGRLDRKKLNVFVFVGWYQRRATTGMRDKEQIRFSTAHHAPSRHTAASPCVASGGRLPSAGCRHFTVWWALVSSHHLLTRHFVQTLALKLHARLKKAAACRR